MNSSNKDTPRTSFLDTDASDDVAFYRALFAMRDAARETCIPVIVIEREDKDGFIKVQPIIRAMKQMSDGVQGYDRKPFLVKPMKFFHGGFTIHAPIFAGDTGYVISCDRDATRAMGKNESVLSKDISSKEITDSHLENPDTIDCSHYVYGFFIPCSWVRNESDEMKGDFGRDDGFFKDKLVISNYHEGGSEGSAYISIDRDGNIEIETENSRVTIDSSGINITNLDDKNSDETSKNARTLSVGKDNLSMYHNAESDESEGTNGVLASKDSVTVEKKLQVFNTDRNIDIDPKELESDGKFRRVRIVTGQPTRDGDVVSIPMATVMVLCDEPIEDDPLVFNVRDSDR